MSKQPFSPRVHYNLDLGVLCDGLGEEVVNLLCQALVGSDRIIGLQSLVVLNSKRDHASVQFEQTLEAVLPMMWGTLHEVSKAIRGLQAHKITGWLKGPEARAAWKELRKISHRALGLTEKFRNRMAFHFDQPTIATGLRALRKEGKPVPAMVSDKTDGKPCYRITLGHAMVIRGLDVDKEQFFKHVGVVKKDQEAVPALLANVVSELFRSVGVQLQVVPQPATMRSWDDPEPLPADEATNVTHVGWH